MAVVLDEAVAGRQRPVAELAACLVAGASCGVAAKLADGPVPRWVSDLGNYPGAYVLLLVLLAVPAAGPVAAAGRAACAAVGLCAGYYAWTVAVLGYPVGRTAAVWLALAVTAVPALAAAVRWAAPRRGVLPGLLLGAVAALPLADGVLHQLWALARSGALQAGYPLHLPQAVLDLACAGLVAGVVPRSTLTRAAALVSAPVLAVAAAAAVGALRSALGV